MSNLKNLTRVKFVSIFVIVAIIAGSVHLLSPSYTLSSNRAHAAEIHHASHSNIKSPAVVDEDEQFKKARQQMVSNDLRGHGIADERVLDAMGRIQRQNFVPSDRQSEAYDDAAIQIGLDQTISRPFIVAIMTELVKPGPGKKALDIGTGSGYQAAVLGETCKDVYSIEILKPLADQARDRLKTLGYKNVNVRCGDGYQGWPEKAPFDIIIVAAAPDHVPQPLIDQLAPGGKLVIPVGSHSQELLLIEKDNNGTVKRREVLPVKFVTMTGDSVKKQKSKM